jgi:hypothetical protein
MRNARIVYRLPPSTNFKQARDARARAWSFIFERYAEKNAAEAIGGERDTHSHRRLGTSKEVKPGTS